MKTDTVLNTGLNLLSQEIIGSCIDVHRALGPGLLESVYMDCLCRDLTLKGVSFSREPYLDIKYKGAVFHTRLRADLIVEKKIIVELKAVENLLPLHEAQLMTYLKLTELELGLLINFNVVLLKSGIQRIRLNHGRFDT